MDDREDTFEMPRTDDNVGKCGIYMHGSYKDGVYQRGRDRYCNEPGVVRMVVDAVDSDESRYHTGPYFVPYMGEEVMVVLCAKHDAEVRKELAAAKQMRADRQRLAEEAQVKVEKLRAELEEAEAELRRAL